MSCFAGGAREPLGCQRETGDRQPRLPMERDGVAPHGVTSLEERPGLGPSGSRRTVLVEVALLGLLALAVRMLNLDHTPQTDEFNHLLAARSFLSDGTLALVEGGPEYTRAPLFTYIVAGFIATLGESFVVARLPAVLAGMALVVALFLAVRGVSDRLSAWVAALLLCFAPIAIEQSQLVRFYSFHGLLFFVGSIAVYRLTDRPLPTSRRAGGLALLALATLGLAYHLQVITMIGLGALAIWALLAAGPALIRLVRARGRLPWFVGGIAVLCVVGAAVATWTGFLSHLLWRFGYVDYWAEARRDVVRFYDWVFLDRYPTLWTLFPVLALVAIWYRARPAVFGTLIFGFAFLVHSLVAWKEERYLLYALPFFFGVCGLAVGVLLPWLYARVREALGRFLTADAGSALVRRLAMAGLTGAFVFVAAENGAASYTARMLLEDDADWRQIPRYRGEADWAAALPLLRPVADSVDVVISSSELKALYFLGRLDFDLVPEDFGITGDRTPEHPFSYKSGRPWVTTDQALRQAMSCFASGLVIVEEGHWLEPIGVTPAQMEYLESHARPLPVPERYRIRAFRWRDREVTDATGCEAVHAAHRAGTVGKPPPRVRR